MLFLIFGGSAKERKDVIKTSEGKLKISMLGHASVRFSYQGIIIYIDPVFNQQKHLPKAGIICLTHSYYDHFNKETIDAISTPETNIICNELLEKKLNKAVSLRYGEKTTISGISFEAVPAYNLNNKFNGSEPYHPYGFGNGYLIRFGELTVYVAGDTDLIPEMSHLPKIDIAFLPVMAPYTMGYEEFIEAVKIIKPGRVYPYHTGVTNLENLPKLFSKEKGVEIIIL